MKTRLISIIRKEFIQLFRDKRLLALIMILPLVQMILLGYAFNNDIRNMPMAVFDQSRSAESRRLLEDYQSSDYFQLKYTVRSDAELRQLIENGQAAVALVIPPDYPAQLYRSQAKVALILDGSDASRASTALSAAQLIAQNHATELLLEKMTQTGLTSGFRRLSSCEPTSGTTRIWFLLTL